MRYTLIALLASLSIVGALVLAAFAWDGESSAEAKQNFCGSLSELSSTVMSYEGFDPSTATTDELDAAADDIERAWDEVADEWYDWAYAADNSLYDAYSDLYYAIEDLPGDYTIAQSLEALEPELNAFPDAFHETFDGSGCTTA